MNRYLRFDFRGIKLEFCTGFRLIPSPEMSCEHNGGDLGCWISCSCSTQRRELQQRNASSHHTFRFGACSSPFFIFFFLYKWVLAARARSSLVHCVHPSRRFRLINTQNGALRALRPPFSPQRCCPFSDINNIWYGENHAKNSSLEKNPRKCTTSSPIVQCYAIDWRMTWPKTKYCTVPSLDVYIIDLTIRR